MSLQHPLRTVRIPVLQRQCLFCRQQRRIDRSLVAPTIRAFSSTPPRAKNYGQRDRAVAEAAAKHQIGPAPQVNLEKMRRDAGAMTEDIGLLQGTIIRAPLRDLPSWYSGDFRSYFWKLLKAKFSGLYSRSAYRGCKQKKGWSKWLPIDIFGKAKIYYTAKNIYEGIYLNFAQGNVRPLQEICLPPLLKKLEDRIASRLPERMEWKLDEFKSCRVVSHRAALLGEEHPDTAYRQAVIRIVSVQSLSITHRPSTTRKGKPTRSSGFWKPDEAKTQPRQTSQPKEIQDNLPSTRNETKGKTVVEYLVLQKRIVSGAEEPWKAWGFATESTMDMVKESEEYWQNTMDYQAAGGV